MLLDKLVIAAVSPLGTALCLALLAGWLTGPRRPLRAGPWAKGLAILALGWLTFWSLPVASNHLRAWLEAEHPPLPVASQPAAHAVVVLGGAMSPPGVDGLPANLSDAADRLWLAAQLYHAGKASVLLLSGGSDAWRSRTSEARAMQQVLATLGVPLHAMWLEEASRNTRENAQGSAALLLPGGRQQILLVTSALHMPRAKALFEAQGFTVNPAATDHTGHEPQGLLGWVPDTGALDGSARAMKELVGRWAGR